MSSRFVIRGAALGAAFAMFVGASSASAVTLRGTVVHRDARAHSFVIALANGRIDAVHARKSPGVGRSVRVSATLLRNGTYAQHAIKIGGRARRARIRGVVTFVDARRGLFTVSRDGASMLVHRSHLARAADALPSVGEDVNVTVGIDDQGDLQDENVQETGTQSSGIDLEGTILAIDPTARTLSVSADDEDQSGQSLTVTIPSTIDMSMFTVGQQVELTVSKQADGTFLLQGSSEDGNQQQANNPSDQQGSDGGSDGSGGGSDSASGSGGTSGSASGGD